MLEAKPFLKWVGGKTQLLGQLLSLFPRQIETYYEPFLGGGAVFFALANQKRFKRAVINDWNQELVDTYRAVRDFPTDLIQQLGKLKYSREIFFELRNLRPEQFSPVRRAARMIYLNKTGFNGLYRVNRDGRFNVPFGKHAKTPKVFDENTLLGCSRALQRFVSIESTDFEMAVEWAAKGDVVYFDPPYVPANPTSNFTSYTKDGFGLVEQQRLARLCRTLVTRGVKVLASNSDTELVRELYSGFELVEVRARRSINSNPKRRGPVGELVIVG